MGRSRAVARDIKAVTEARCQAILPLHRGMRVSHNAAPVFRLLLNPIS